MANKVSFIFIAQDRYSRTVRSVTQMTQALRNKVNGLGASFAGADSRLKRLSERAKKTGEGFKEFGARAFAGIVLPLGFISMKMVNAARDAEETRSKFATVFKDMAAESEATADSLAKDFGLAGTKARQLLGDTGDLLTGFGFTQEQALATSKRVNELAVDLASFTNYAGGAEGASAALTKALLGERESLKSLGIAISEENVKQEIGILIAQGRTFASLRQAKAEATLSLAVKQSKNAIGDFARTSASLANQERILAARTQDTAEQFGRLLLPIKLAVVQGLAKFLVWLNELSPTTKKWLLIITGAVLVVATLTAALGALAFMLPLVAAGAALLLSPFALIPIAIAAVIAAGVLLYENVEWVRDGVNNAVHDITLAWDNLIDLVSDWMAAIDRAVTGTWDGIVESIQPAIDLITKAFDKIMAVRSAAQGMVGEAFTSVKGFFGFAPEVPQAMPAALGFSGPVDMNSRSRTDVNVNLRAPEGAVESIKSRTSGNAPGLNVGVNMATAGAM